MDLTFERALELHRQMWTDMRTKLGNNPSDDERWEFKRNWVLEHFPDERIGYACFLCEYALNMSMKKYVCHAVCEICPIEWGASGTYKNTCEKVFGTNWQYSPISEILALPVRK